MLPFLSCLSFHPENPDSDIKLGLVAISQPNLLAGPRLSQIAAELIC